MITIFVFCEEQETRCYKFFKSKSSDTRNNVNLYYTILSIIHKLNDVRSNS